MRRCRYDPAALISQCEAHGMTRSAVACVAGLSPATITRLATGERGSNPSAATIDGLQRAVAACVCKADDTGTPGLWNPIGKPSGIP